MADGRAIYVFPSLYIPSTPQYLSLLARSFRCFFSSLAIFVFPFGLKRGHKNIICPLLLMQWPCCQAIYFSRLQRSIPLHCQWWWIVSPRDQRSLPLCRLFRLQTCHKELWVCSLYLFASLRLLSKSLWCTLHKLITNTTWNSLKGQICRK